MKKTGFAILVALALSACATSIMRDFVGEPVQRVMVRYGSPANAFDMPDGRRAFQWVMGSSYTPPAYVSQTGNATAIGNTVWWTQNSQISGGQPIHSECTYTMYGRWNETQNAWIIEGFEQPSFMCQ
jgi:hypothetical protein